MSLKVVIVAGDFLITAKNAPQLIPTVVLVPRQFLAVLSRRSKIAVSIVRIRHCTRWIACRRQRNQAIDPVKLGRLCLQWAIRSLPGFSCYAVVIGRKGDRRGVVLRVCGRAIASVVVAEV